MNTHDRTSIPSVFPLLPIRATLLAFVSFLAPAGLAAQSAIAITHVDVVDVWAGPSSRSQLVPAESAVEDAAAGVAMMDRGGD